MAKRPKINVVLIKRPILKSNQESAVTPQMGGIFNRDRRADVSDLVSRDLVFDR